MTAITTAIPQNRGELSNKEEDPLNIGSTGLNQEEEAFTENEGSELLIQGNVGLMNDENANLDVRPSEIDEFREYVLKGGNIGTRQLH